MISKDRGSGGTATLNCMAAMQGLALKHDYGDIRTMAALWSTARLRLTCSAEYKERICRSTAEAQLQGARRLPHSGNIMAFYCVALLDLTNKETVNRQRSASTGELLPVPLVLAAHSPFHRFLKLFARFAGLHTSIYARVPTDPRYTSSTTSQWQPGRNAAHSIAPLSSVSLKQKTPTLATRRCQIVMRPTSC